MNVSKTFDATIATIIAVSATVSMSFILFTLDRGFEFTDEAYYLIAAAHPESLALWLSAVHWFTSVLWGLAGSATTFRFAGLILLCLGALTLSFGVAKYLEE